MTHHLNDDADLFYLLREFDVAYRYAPHGGSAAIRAHMRRVRERISRVLKDNPAVEFTVPSRVPVNAHMTRALDNGQQDAAEGFVRATAKMADRFVWQHGYEKLPAALARKYGYADILGPGGLVRAEDIALGFVLFGPGCVYPSHKHDGITESYIVLSGACSQNDIGVFRAPSMIFNAPGTTHTIRTSANEPCLLAYAWTAEPQDMVAHKMRFTRTRKPKGPNSN
ncbi:MAG: dimethylsulfoniopropionate lyase [Phyllobacteriaceae bacterium]|jgi:dimethylpropiothetin dethiomethylase|nr:dimethylsulfoniopropionate lyase [Phyllobacteriaceae bacterium]